MGKTARWQVKRWLQENSRLTRETMPTIKLSSRQMEVAMVLHAITATSTAIKRLTVARRNATRQTPSLKRNNIRWRSKITSRNFTPSTTFQTKKTKQRTRYYVSGESGDQKQNQWRKR